MTTTTTDSTTQVADFELSTELKEFRQKVRDYTAEHLRDAAAYDAETRFPREPVEAAGFPVPPVPEDAAAETVAVEVLWLPLPPEVEEVSVCSDEFSNVCDRITIKPLILSKKVVGVGRSGRYR